MIGITGWDWMTGDWSAFLIILSSIWVMVGLVGFLITLAEWNDLKDTCAQEPSPTKVIRWWVKWTLWGVPAAFYFLVIGIVKLVRVIELGFRDALFLTEDE